jgi:hypothetical protein
MDVQTSSYRKQVHNSKMEKSRNKKSDLLLRVHDLAYKYKITCLGKSEVIERNLRNWHFK